MLTSQQDEHMYRKYMQDINNISKNIDTLRAEIMALSMDINTLASIINRQVYIFEVFASAYVGSLDVSESAKSALFDLLKNAPEINYNTK